jgi:DNA polymerase III delta prime subunit
MKKKYIWAERYRPKTIDDCILPKGLKETFKNHVENKSAPHMLLSGTSGIGKTTVALAMIEEMGSEYLFLNASNEGIDVLRNEIQQFASSVSFYGGRKYVILDEADKLSHGFQDALRGVIEEFSGNTSFILTCNHPEKLSEAIHSRCPTIEFKIPVEEREQLAMEFYKRAKTILNDNEIPFDNKVVGALITKFFPDWRRIIGELQNYSVKGKIDSGVLANLRNVSVDILFGFLKENNFNEIRKWCAEETLDPVSIFRQIYDDADNFLKSDSIPQLVLLIAKYQEMNSRCVDKEINLVAFFVECMIDLSFL